MNFAGFDFDLNHFLQMLFAALAAYYGGKAGGHKGANGG